MSSHKAIRKQDMPEYAEMRRAIRTANTRLSRLERAGVSGKSPAYAHAMKETGDNNRYSLKGSWQEFKQTYKQAMRFMELTTSKVKPAKEYANKRERLQDEFMEDKNITQQRAMWDAFSRFKNAMQAGYIQGEYDSDQIFKMVRTEIENYEETYTAKDGTVKTRKTPRTKQGKLKWGETIFNRLNAKIQKMEDERLDEDELINAENSGMAQSELFI